MALNWKGTIDNDFFNELNWQDSITFISPSASTINPGVAIIDTLSITNVTKKIIANGIINLGTQSLTIGTAWLSATAITGTASSLVTINNRGYIDLSSATPITGVAQVNFTSALSWLRTPNFSNTSANSTISQFKVSGITATYSTNLRLDNYYLNGCVIRSKTNTETPLIVYDSMNLSGTSLALSVDTIHTSAGTLSGMNNTIESFLLRKGYMATFATEVDGTGKSKVYIASEEDLMINVLPTTLQNTISFVRVLPWNWVNKKGVNEITYTGLNAKWRYDWNDSSLSSRDFEFVPMSWGSNGTSAGAITIRIAAYGTTHELSFNEPDNGGQSGGFNGFTDFNVTVPYHKELMKIGCRLVSPVCVEDQVFVYLKNFRDLARNSNVRYDAIATHFSDWGGYSGGETGVTATQIFNRFKIYLKKVYDVHGLPIWLTEFNANPNRSTALHEGFMTLALPYLESCDYVERYAWFEPSTGNGYLYNGGVFGNGITTLGIIYRDHVSTPSIPENVVNQRNNLNLKS